MRQPDHRHIHRAVSLVGVHPGGQTVLIVDVHPGIGNHAHHRQAGKFRQLGKAGAQNVHIAPEFVDDQALDPLALLFVQQRHCTIQLSKYAAPVDIACQQHRRIHQLGQTHVHDVVFPQIDFRRTARTLDDQNVVFLRQTVVGLQHMGNQPGFVFEVIRRRVIAPDLTVHNHLTASIAAGLEQDGIHPHVRLAPGRLPGCFRHCPAHRPGHAQRAHIGGKIQRRAAVFSLKARPVATMGQFLLHCS